MNRMRRPISKKHALVTTLISLVGAAVLFVLFKGLSLNPTMVKSNLIGKEAKNFEVELLDGSSYHRLPIERKAEA